MRHLDTLAAVLGAVPDLLGDASRAIDASRQIVVDESTGTVLPAVFLVAVRTVPRAETCSQLPLDQILLIVAGLRQSSTQAADWCEGERGGEKCLRALGVHDCKSCQVVRLTTRGGRKGEALNKHSRKGWLCLASKGQTFL